MDAIAKKLVPGSNGTAAFRETAVADTRSLRDARITTTTRIATSNACENPATDGITRSAICVEREQPPRRPGLRSFSSETPLAPGGTPLTRDGDGRILISANPSPALLVHKANVPRQALQAALQEGNGLTFKLNGMLHSHKVVLSPYDVDTLARSGSLTVRSKIFWGLIVHRHTVTLTADTTVAKAKKFDAPPWLSNWNKLALAVIVGLVGFGVVLPAATVTVGALVAIGLGYSGWAGGIAGLGLIVAALVERYFRFRD